MSLGCPVPVSVWQEQKGEWISQIAPPPSQGANVLGVQQMEPDGSPAPCPGKVGGNAVGVGGTAGRKMMSFVVFRLLRGDGLPAGRSLRCSRGDWM